MELVIKIGAAAGQGAFVTGRIVGKLFARGGYHVFGYPEYPSLIRGGHNAYEIRVSDKPIFAPLTKADVLLAVNKDAIVFHKDGVKEEGVILADAVAAQGMEDARIISLPVAKKLNELGAPLKMANTAYIASLLAMVGYPIEPLHQLIEETFSKKGQEVVELNKKVADAFYAFAKEQREPIASLKPLNGKRLYISGNEAAALGALSAGLKFYAAYPMTPASNVLHYLVSVKKKAGIAVVQAEDEISAANMAVGASFAGVRAMTGTSGGGFALMTETVGMAALAETPIVFYLAQRVGPSTGMPTWTEQADLFQVLGASQGEFLRVILAPLTIEDSYYVTGEALNIAERYQLPVFVLTDKFIAESHSTVEDFKPIPIDRGKLITSIEEELPLGKRYLRYKDTEDGISPRPIPGVKNGLHIGTSYEHREDSFTTEDFDERKKQVDKRMRKLKALLQESWEPWEEGEGDVALIVWGSQWGPAVEGAKISGLPIKVIGFRWLYPLSKEKVEKAIGDRKVVFLENNSTGLFSKLVKMETGIEADGLILKYTGRPFFPEQVAKALKELSSRGWRGEVRYAEDFEKYEFYAPWRYK